MTLQLAIIGAGKVGRGLAQASRAAGHQVQLHPWRRGLPQHQLQSELLLLALRDSQVTASTQALGHLLPQGIVVAHLSGALSAEALAPLRSAGAWVAQLHPLLSFADGNRPPHLTGGHALVRGDPAGLPRLQHFCRSLGLVPRSWPKLDLAAYHAAAALLANGSCALAAGAAQVLQSAGAPAAELPQALGPLLRSVADNIEHLGVPAALSGPIRRGAVPRVQEHLSRIQQHAPELLELYRELARAQLALALELQDAEAADLAALAKLLGAK